MPGENDRLQLTGSMPAPQVLSEGVIAFDRSMGELPGDRFRPVPIGIPWLDEVFAGGMHPGGQYLLLGKQNVGKTTFILQQVRHIARWARQERVAVLPFLLSYEHTVWELFTRLLCIESWHIDPQAPLDYALINAAVVRAAEEYKETPARAASLQEIGESRFLQALFSILPDIAFQAYQQVMGYAEDCVLYWASRTYTAVEEIEKMVDHLHAATGRSVLLMGDFLQSMPPPHRYLSSRLGESSRDFIVGTNIQALKDLAQTRHIPVCMVSSIDRDALKDPRPVHVEDADGPEVIPYVIDGAVVLNREVVFGESGSQINLVREKQIRISVEKNRNHGPSEIERSHVIYGGSFFIDPLGSAVDPRDSYQQTRIARIRGGQTSCIDDS